MNGMCAVEPVAHAILLIGAVFNRLALLCAAVHGWQVHEDNKMDVSNGSMYHMAAWPHHLMLFDVLCCALRWLTRLCAQQRFRREHKLDPLVKDFVQYDTSGKYQRATVRTHRGCCSDNLVDVNIIYPTRPCAQYY
jgi:hypothetical protein